MNDPGSESSPSGRQRGSGNAWVHSADSILIGIAAFVFLAGCTTVPQGEKSARHDVATVAAELKPADVSRIAIASDIAALSSASSETDFVRFAVYHHPDVRAAYYDWKAAVASIAPARALPDPQFTFQADITKTLMSFMPGLMFDIMSSGKRQAMAREAIATSAVAYREYVAAVLRVAGNARKAWVELAYANQVNELFHETITTADAAVALATSDYTTGRGMPNFEQQVRFENILAQHHAHHAGVAERLVAARAGFKSALGLLPSDPDPAWPNAQLALTPVLPEAELWRRAQAANADLARMRAMVDMTVAQIEVAQEAGTSDFTVGSMVDLKQNPLMFRPTATVTLPIWREKIQANVAAAEARRDAAAARFSAEQLNLAAELARMLYMVRDADRMLNYMDQQALPNLERSAASAEAAVQSGMASPTAIAEAQLMTIDMQHDRIDVLRERENAVVDLGLLIANVLPANAPLVAAQSPVPSERIGSR